MKITRRGIKSLLFMSSLFTLCTLTNPIFAQDTPLEPDDTGIEGDQTDEDKTPTKKIAPKTVETKTTTTTKTKVVTKTPTNNAALQAPPKIVSTKGSSKFVFASELNETQIASGNAWRLVFGGYIRLQYTAIQNDDRAPLIGRNDGFLLANARPTFTGELNNGLGFRLQFETAANLDAPNTLTPAQEMVVRPRDTYIFYRPLPYLELQLGQFKPPHDLEALLSTSDIAFIERSIGSTGVRRFTDVRPQFGLSIDRQVGLQLAGKFYPMSENNKPVGFGVGYGLAVTNGTSSNTTTNDNDSLAYYGRASLHWGEMVTLGGAFYLNDLLAGSPPDEALITRTGWTADLLVKAFGVHAMGSIMQQKNTTALFVNRNPEGVTTTYNTAMTYQAQLGYKIPFINVMPSVRYAFFDPTADFNLVDIDDPGMDNRDVDALTYITLGLSYIPDTYPITVMLNYTLANEQEDSESIDNNRLEALVQLTW